MDGDSVVSASLKRVTRSKLISFLRKVDVYPKPEIGNSSVSTMVFVEYVTSLLLEAKLKENGEVI